VFQVLKKHTVKKVLEVLHLNKVIPEVTLSLGPSLILSFNLCFIHNQSYWVIGYCFRKLGISSEYVQELILTRLDSTKHIRINAQVMQTQKGR
jgi:hypothetical protein